VALRNYLAISRLFCFSRKCFLKIKRNFLYPFPFRPKAICGPATEVRKRSLNSSSIPCITAASSLIFFEAQCRKSVVAPRISPHLRPIPDPHPLQSPVARPARKPIRAHAPAVVGVHGGHGQGAAAAGFLACAPRGPRVPRPFKAVRAAPCLAPAAPPPCAEPSAAALRRAQCRRTTPSRRALQTPSHRPAGRGSRALAKPRPAPARYHRKTAPPSRRNAASRGGFDPATAEGPQSIPAIVVHLPPW
jgi:hypothetical protein